eukprot:Blabericola_migrator_1__4326@NODE_232_length_11063_cov_34_815387_g197_i0_p6_GENE_NODE_232_length_11063_cov_34_815387_g197_i0NODE_232_length_11063_cov_34_815387_g197_i0_p6_ORF_typecomplete_len116_score8_63_NODE_232_length_11063_cov_34_815387_g197_i062046551
MLRMRREPPVYPLLTSPWQGNMMVSEDSLWEPSVGPEQEATKPLSLCQNLEANITCVKEAVRLIDTTLVLPTMLTASKSCSVNPHPTNGSQHFFCDGSVSHFGRTSQGSPFQTRR